MFNYFGSLFIYIVASVAILAINLILHSKDNRNIYYKAFFISLLIAIVFSSFTPLIYHSIEDTFESSFLMFFIIFILPLAPLALYIITQKFLYKLLVYIKANNILKWPQGHFRMLFNTAIFGLKDHKNQVALWLRTLEFLTLPDTKRPTL